MLSLPRTQVQRTNILQATRCGGKICRYRGKKLRILCTVSFLSKVWGRIIGKEKWFEMGEAMMSWHWLAWAVCACLLSHFSWFFATLWTVTHQAPLSMGIHQAGVLEWVTMFSSRGSSWPRDWTCVSYVCLIDIQVLYHRCHLVSPSMG